MTKKKKRSHPYHLSLKGNFQELLFSSMREMIRLRVGCKVSVGQKR